MCILCTCTQINGQLTLRENIADNGGIHTAYRAYRNVMKGKSEQHGGYSGDQLFFIAYAQVYTPLCIHGMAFTHMTVQVQTGLADTSPPK